VCFLFVSRFSLVMCNFVVLYFDVFFIHLFQLSAAIFNKLELSSALDSSDDGKLEVNVNN